ncbi:MAG: UDP-N-acetylmuramate dehydrogenase [Gammaproteobacteria bacterium]|nr:MAG: UDP-N-acetylmuramate dehydrogenase [Gammaproteobacteria bacterium]
MMALKTSHGLRGRLLRHEPMSRHTSWRVGGPADSLYIPADLDDLVAFLKQLPANEPLHWVGLGSNLLVRDGGVRGTVVMTSGALNGLSLLSESMVRAEAGVASAKVARYSTDHHLTGAEFLAGIPGTIGGALAMNAGAFGGETWNIVHAVETLDRHGELRVHLAADYEVGYRHVAGPAGEWFVAARFRLLPDERRQGKALIKSLLAKRGATQPTQLPNAGSVFKNPPNYHAARLIEAAGLKGAREGGASVSDMHANFIVNQNGATAADIERLIARVQAEVHKKSGVQLEPEVRVMGEEAV